MGELTAGMLIETALQVQMARATDGTAPELAECVREASAGWWLAFQLASAGDEKDEGPGLFGGTEQEPASERRATHQTTQEMVREEAAMRNIARTWAFETLQHAPNHWLDEGEVVLDFLSMLDRREVRLDPRIKEIGQIVAQEICSVFAGVEQIADAAGPKLRHLAKKAVPA